MPSSSLAEALRRVQEEASRLPPPRLEGAEEVVVAGCPGGEAGALVFYLALRHSGLRASRADCIEAAVHMLPYTEGGEAVVAFSGGGRDTHLLHLASAAAALEVELAAYGPPLHPAYADQFAEYGFTYTPVAGPEPPLTLMVASILWSPKPWGPRRERLAREIGSLPEAAEWAWSALSGAVDALAGGVEVIAYTPSTEAGAVYALGKGLARSLAPLHAIGSLRGSRVLAAYTSVEEHAYRQALLAARMRGVEVAEARINTDPLTAPLYLALAALRASASRGSL
jgi:hypothetical protein